MKRWGIIGCWLAVISAGVADSAFVDFELGLIFPQVLAGMTNQAVDTYDVDELGYRLIYRNDQQMDIQVRVYDLGRATIPAGYKSGLVSSVFRRVEEIQQADLADEEISEIRMRGSAIVPKQGDIRFSNQVYQYLEPRMVEGKTKMAKRLQSVYATCAHNQFFEVQFKFDAAAGETARSIAEELVSDMVKIIEASHSEEDLLVAACDAFLRNPSGFQGRSAAQRIIAQTEVMADLNVYPDLFAWPQNLSKPQNADLLVVAYFAGMLQEILPQRLEVGGEHEGFSAMLQAYAEMRKRKDIRPLRQLDEWLLVPDKHALFESLLIDDSGN